MRTLILSCNTGGGHNTCAAALVRAYEQRGLVCHVADALQFTSLRLSRFLSWGHTAMYRHLPGLFHRGYRFAERHPGLMNEDGLQRLLGSGSRRLYEYIRQGEYDAVLCVHVFAGLLLRQMLQEHPLPLRTGFVATDYTCSPGAACGALDRYFIPHESLADEFVACGVPGDRLVVSGIPIDERFGGSRRESAELRHHLVLMCGSMGCGPLEELTAFFARRLGEDTALTVVCGNNGKLRCRLTELTENCPNIRVCGFVDDMAALLGSAEVCLTKPGGLSATEAAAAGVPMVLIDAVAGCEAHNMRFFLNSGGAVTADEPQALGELCLSLLDDPARRAEMAACLRSVSRPDAAAAVCAVMEHECRKEGDHGCLDRI